MTDLDTELPGLHVLLQPPQTAAVNICASSICWGSCKTIELLDKHKESVKGGEAGG